MKHRIRVAGILRQGNEILLVEQENPRSGERKWTTPGGGLEPTDADIFAGVVREVFEETGLHVKPGSILFISEFVSHVTQVMQISVWIECFPAEGTEFGEVTLEHTRPDDYLTNIKWWSKEALNLSPNKGSTLQNSDFWLSLEANTGAVCYLGKKVELGN